MVLLNSKEKIENLELILSYSINSNKLIKELK